MKMSNIIYTGVTNSVILNREPSLADWYFTGTTSWDTIITQAKRVLLNAVMKQSKKWRLFCTPLSIYTDDGTTITGTAWTSDSSSEDKLNRALWCVEMIAGTGTHRFYLQGSDNGTDWNFITNTETEYLDGTPSANFFFDLTTGGKELALIDQTYKYYRIYIATATACQFNSYLIESSFHFTHLYLSLAMINQALSASQDTGRWLEKYELYNGMYEAELNTMLASYDADDDGEIQTYEEMNTVKRTRLYR